MSEEDPPRPTPEEIAADSSLPVEAVLEAIAYCETNPPEIASDSDRFALRLYLDDDLASPLLARLRRQAGHDVQLPLDAGRSGKVDPVHLAHAVRDSRALVTRNYKDFEDLHDLVLAVRRHHSGIFVVRRDNDPKRNLRFPGSVRAIGNLLASVPITDEYLILNHWR